MEEEKTIDFLEITKVSSPLAKLKIFLEENKIKQLIDFDLFDDSIQFVIEKGNFESTESVRDWFKEKGFEVIYVAYRDFTSGNSYRCQPKRNFISKFFIKEGKEFYVVQVSESSRYFENEIEICDSGEPDTDEEDIFMTPDEEPLRESKTSSISYKKTLLLLLLMGLISSMVFFGLLHFSEHKRKEKLLMVEPLELSTEKMPLDSIPVEQKPRIREKIEDYIDRRHGFISELTFETEYGEKTFHNATFWKRLGSYQILTFDENEVLDGFCLIPIKAVIGIKGTVNNKELPTDAIIDEKILEEKK